MGLLRLVACATIWSIVQAQVKILSPQVLRDKYAKTGSMIIGSTSVFGAPYYGEKVVGHLRLPYKQNGQVTHHCKDSDYDLREVDSSEYEFEGEHVEDILVLPHGRHCSAVTKVRVAERKGVKAVILVEQTGMSEEKVQNTLDGGDGEGIDIQIPSILVSQKTGDELELTMQSRSVVVELAWDIPRSQIVTADFWRSSGSKEAVEFLTRFKDIAYVLHPYLQFVPRYYIFDVPAGANAGDLCADFAPNTQTRHCAPDPDGPGPITGADVANEDVRQLCLWHTTATGGPNEAKYSSQWWVYVTRLMDFCQMTAPDRVNRFGSSACSWRIMETVAGLNAETLSKVEDCVKNNQDKYLEEQARQQAWSEEALRINGWRYQGALDPQIVLKAICSGFATPISECDGLLAGPFTQTMFIAVHSLTGGFSTTSFVLMILGILILTVVNCYLYRRHLLKLIKRQMREEVMLEVQSHMSEYARMDKDGDNI